MAKLKIVWSTEADRKFYQILLYYHAVTGNNKYGRKLGRMIKDSLKLVAHYPYMYPASLVEAIFDTRQDPAKDIYQ